MTIEEIQVSPGELGKFLNLSPQKVYNWRKSGLFPEGTTRGKLPLQASVRAYCRMLQESVDHKQPLNLQHERARLAKHQADHLALKLGRETRLVIPALEVEDATSRGFKVVADHLENLPDLLERDCGIDADTVIRLRRAIDGFRDAMYREIQELPGGDAPTA